ncbi:MAG: hypothetical protein IBJ14_13680 [Hydrogenophaga sp.]|nr:hypothetical protein [Hydrogenophaga sp.]
MSTALAATSTDALLSALLTRWDIAHARDATASVGEIDDALGPMERVRLVLERTLSDYAPYFDASDSSLYRRLLDTRDVETLSALFFRCFDLMVRSRGLAIAVLRQHEIYRVLQPHIPR